MRLKIKDTDYIILKKAIIKVENYFPDARQALLNKGKTLNEYRWSILWIAIDDNYLPNYFMKSLYEYLNDSHISSALNRIIKK